MVSTRGIKARFVEGERVLCYEPDPTKAKVLYESKVLQLVYNKDGRGRKQLEYLIHFQGWNASWDRCVDEDLVLKDTEENRALQKRLMETAQINLKEKKKKRCLSDTIREIVEEREKLKHDKVGSETSSQAGHTDDDEINSMNSSDSESVTHTSDSIASRSYTPADAEILTAATLGTASATCDVATSSVPPVIISHSTGGEEAYSREFPIEIPAALKTVLERDHHYIKDKHKLVQLPTAPAALTVLEDYVVFFATRYLARTSERRRNETRLKDKAYLTLDLCKEVMDGVRVCFDFHCRTHLLYAEELAQAATLAAMQLPPMLTTAPAAANNRDLNLERGKDDRSRGGDEGSGGGRRLTRSGGRSSSAADTSLPSAHTNSESGRSTPVSSVCSSQPQQQTGATSLPQQHRILRDADTTVNTGLVVAWPDLAQWTLLPVEHRKQGTATLVYGPMHLLRLFVKLPEILYRMNLSPEKKKIIIKHLQLFLEYLDVHNQEFFSETHYVTIA